MAVDPAAAKHHTEYKGVVHYFCSGNCAAKFIADPNYYLNPDKPVAVQPARKSIIYTCPMHPQIRRMEPGNCPICGMALEPVRATEDTGPS
jgi:Cu+-exporting ATPase